MKKFFGEFKEFISKGNVLDLAIGMIIGAAFTAIVNSLVNDIIAPFLNVLTGGFSFDSMCVTLPFPWVPVGDRPVIAFGPFLKAIITFLITAFVLFLVIKGINAIKKAARKNKNEVPADPTTRICPFCKSEVDIDATKCKFCTSDLPELEYEAPAEAPQA